MAAQILLPAKILCIIVGNKTNSARDAERKIRIFNMKDLYHLYYSEKQAKLAGTAIYKIDTLGFSEYEEGKRDYEVEISEAMKKNSGSKWDDAKYLGRGYFVRRGKIGVFDKEYYNKK